ncbi:hypothetical protein [Jiangella sp. DSM 45060]|uniref:hypothetical protein n=1 Tax=Jiangella sp. DSM 45060 TaxID=1798224 RepID=UPI00087BF2C1|nr:hypothetical protein [Jiangella sp. DSM 45060]SDT36575.1 hypothetical protein SAMN04515669_3734 [Jiangella sp. DSM 45060]
MAAHADGQDVVPSSPARNNHYDFVLAAIAVGAAAEQAVPHTPGELRPYAYAATRIMMATARLTDMLRRTCAAVAGTPDSIGRVVDAAQSHIVEAQIQLDAAAEPDGHQDVIPETFRSAASAITRAGHGLTCSTPEEVASAAALTSTITMRSGQLAHQLVRLSVVVSAPHSTIDPLVAAAAELTHAVDALDLAAGAIRSRHVRAAELMAFEREEHRMRLHGATERQPVRPAPPTLGI